MLVAPWWKWPGPVDTQGGRLTRPAFQKYDAPTLVAQFLARPQRHLAFVEEDLVHVTRPAPPVPLGSNGKPRRLSELAYVPDGTNTRKIFLDTHKRFYLVVCELHCDAPGFPKASRDDLCEAGFVVRRRTTDVPAAGAREAGAILRDINTARSRLTEIDRAAPLAMAVGAESTIVRQRASTRALLALERQRLRAWADRFGVAPQLQGWYPSATADKVGAWHAVDEKPAEIAGEATFPMYPLVPPPNAPRHDGVFGTIFFGLLPTGTGETDDRGRARFDDRQLYEVTCFARRHTKAHPRGTPCPCPDGLFWSQPTEPYKLAPHFDLAGTGKRPVTVQMPDLADLAAQAAPTPGVSFAKPPGSLMIKGNSDGSVGSHSRSTVAEVCSFSIPLITIVASFVLELFLPVVVFLFGLWFMLKLKFCVPPEVSLAAGITGEISLGISASEEAALAPAVNASVDASFGDAPEIAAALKSELSPIAAANMLVSLKNAAPSLTEDLIYVPEVVHP
jgi:hypothetical protein